MYLNDIWAFYFHDPYEMDWSINSFKFINNISKIEDFIEIYLCFKDIIHKGMFFFMREHILPIWKMNIIIMEGVFHISYIMIIYMKNYLIYYHYYLGKI